MMMMNIVTVFDCISKKHEICVECGRYGRKEKHIELVVGTIWIK
jgi:hypothetical protein